MSANAVLFRLQGVSLDEVPGLLLVRHKEYSRYSKSQLFNLVREAFERVVASAAPTDSGTQEVGLFQHDSAAVK